MDPHLIDLVCPSRYKLKNSLAIWRKVSPTWKDVRVAVTYSVGNGVSEQLWTLPVRKIKIGEVIHTLQQSNNEL